VVAREASRYRAATKEGEGIGKLIVPRLGLNMILVDGTDESSLERGPGRALQTYMPGQHQLVYIAGHRTTYLAPFSHIERLKTNDIITLRVPYATFTYRVFMHVIVPATDVSRLISHGREVIALQACHPRFFATHRYIVYGRLVKVAPVHGRPYKPTA
jgi:sortase A